MGGFKYYYKNCPVCGQEIEFMMESIDTIRIEICPKCKCGIKLTEKVELEIITRPEYDEKTCITAGELRKTGMEIPEQIPDCAWIPRCAMIYEPNDDSFKVEKTGDENFKFTYGDVKFLEPFRWVNGTFEIGGLHDKT